MTNEQERDTLRVQVAALETKLAKVREVAREICEYLEKRIITLHDQNEALIEVAEVAKDVPAHLDRLTKMLRDANEHPEQIRITETLAANLRYTLRVAEGGAK